MKKLLIGVSILVLFCGILLTISSYLVEHKYERVHKELIPVGDIVIQHDQTILPFYTESGEGPVGEWLGFTPKLYSYQGDSKVYSYFQLNGARYQVREPVEKGWLFQKLYFPIQHLFFWGLSASSFSLLMFFLFWIQFPKKYVNSHKNHDSKRNFSDRQSPTFSMLGSQKANDGEDVTILGNMTPEFIGKDADEFSELELENKRLRREITQAEMLVQQSKALAIKNSNEVTLALQQENTKLVRALSIQKSQEKLALEELAGEYEERIAHSEQLHHEFKVRKNVEIRDLEASLSNVTQEFERLQHDLLAFNVEYRDPRYESIKKGRLFEIYVAKALTEKLGCSILEWTPDKGTYHNIKVQQDGNPDFVVEAPNRIEFAIECKYRRSNSVRRASDKRTIKSISWAAEYQAQRYLEFKEKRKIPVYVAVGLGLSEEHGPSNPMQCLVVDLDTLKSASQELKVIFSGKEIEQLCFQHSSFHKDKSCAINLGWQKVLRNVLS